MRKQEKINAIVVNTVCILALLLILFPLLLIAKYNYPSADDWSFGMDGYSALKNGEGVLGILAETIQTVKTSYLSWEGRYSSTFFASLQPGIWGEKYYGIVAWLMLGGIIFSQFFLTNTLLNLKSRKGNVWFCVPIIVPALILQILYSPSPVESFYWYTGSVNYTFVYGLSLVLLALFIRLSIEDYPAWKTVLLSAVSCLLAILVSGNNFATSLSCALTLFLLSVLFLLFHKKAFRKTWFITALSIICLLLCIFAPANKYRIAANFHGETGSALNAVIMSLVRSFTNIYSWTNIKVVLMLFFILPFVWKAVKNINYSFRFPGLFTLITFGLYASQATATMYVDGTTGGGRMAAILFYSYYVWTVGNFCYWVGWLQTKQWKFRNILDTIITIVEKYLVPYCAIIGILLVGIIYVKDLRNLTSYQAYRGWRQGWAQQYAAEWEERLKILHDDNIKEVEFAPLSTPPDLLLIYTDLQDENGYVWVNDACAAYYDKEYVHVREPDE